MAKIEIDQTDQSLVIAKIIKQKQQSHSDGVTVAPSNQTEKEKHRMEPMKALKKSTNSLFDSPVFFSCLRKKSLLCFPQYSQGVLFPAESLAGFPSQKNHRRKGSGSSDDNISTRKMKLQTSFPPIHLSLISNSKQLDKKLKDYASNGDLSKETRVEKINLPHVEKAATPKPTKSFTDKSKYAKDFGCSINNLASMPTVTLEEPKDSRPEKPNWLEISIPKTASDRLSPEILKTAECPSCKNERRMKADYDKIILQSKRKKEAFQLRVSELEAEFRKRETSKMKEEACEDGTDNAERSNRGHLFLNNSKDKSSPDWEEFRILEKSNREKQDQIDCLLEEIEELNSRLSTMQHGEKDQEQLLKSNQSKLASDIENLKSQLERARERENLKVSCLEKEKRELLSQLENANAEVEKLRKKRPHAFAEMAKERDCCLLELEKLKAYCDKMKVENLSLSDTIKALQQELEKRSSGFSSQGYTAGAEVLLLSHGVSQEKGYGAATDYKFQEVCSCGHSSSLCHKNAVIQMEEEVTMREIYRQMKRERNLLLDVMVIMYERRWFVEEAVPYVRRALRKCGAPSAIPDTM
ncbi:uncharacterized protein PAF06_007909 [Gastrophryne carolinensis]